MYLSFKNGYIFQELLSDKLYFIYAPHIYSFTFCYTMWPAVLLSVKVTTVGCNMKNMSSPWLFYWKQFYAYCLWKGYYLQGSSLFCAVTDAGSTSFPRIKPLASCLSILPFTPGTGSKTIFLKYILTMLLLWSKASCGHSWILEWILVPYQGI